MPAALSVPPEHVILLRRDRTHANQVETPLDVEITDELATGNNHRLYLRVVGSDGPTDDVIEADVTAHPYQMMGVSERRDRCIALALEETVAIPLADHLT
jgi:hypothetical protein